MISQNYHILKPVLLCHPMKQMNFFKNKEFPIEFGGELLKGKRKTCRPLSTKNPIHLVMRANNLKSKNLLKSRQLIDAYLRKYAIKFNIKIYQKGLEWNHLHLVIKSSRREEFQNFLRSFTGVIALKLNLTWVYRPYTRVLKWGRDFRNALSYTLQNELEGLGLIPYQPRGRPRSSPIK